MDSEKTAFGDKLLDPRWLAREARVIHAAEGFCQACGNTTGELRAHFFEYTTTDPWDESSFNLTALCQRCHEWEHGARGSAERLLLSSLEKMNFLAVDVVELVQFIHANFQPRSSRMADDRMRRIKLAEAKFTAEPLMEELRERIRVTLEAFAQRLKEGMVSESDEYRALQKELADLIEERRRRGEAFEAAHDAIAPPDEITFQALRSTRPLELGE